MTKQHFRYSYDTIDIFHFIMLLKTLIFENSEKSIKCPFSIDPALRPGRFIVLICLSVCLFVCLSAILSRPIYFLSPYINFPRAFFLKTWISSP